MNTSIFDIRKRFSLSWLPVLLAALVLVGCDSEGSVTGPGQEATVQVQGAVTDDAGYGKSAARIEGATVTAASVDASGRLSSLDGQATTNAEGRFDLDVTSRTDVMVVTAQKADFTSRTLVYTGGQTSGTVRSMPMTTESKAEADVYVEARQRDSGNTVTEADIVAYVDAQLAADIETGATTAAQVAAAIQSSTAAEDEYMEEDETVDDSQRPAARERKRDRFLTLQGSLYAASSTSAQASALQAFEEAYANIYAEAGVSVETQAKARQAGKAALVRSSASTSTRARSALRQRASVMAGWARAQAIEAAFRAEGAAQARLDALAAARARMMADLRAAASESNLSSAEARYATSVEAELATELGISSVLITTAKTGLVTIKSALDATIGSTTSAEVIARAHASFFADAEASAKMALATSSKATLGGKVLALISAQ